MARNKDPAVLFYTSDFLVGCASLSMEERGQYITLLCLQHQQGHLSDKTIRLAVGEPSPDVMAKFDVDHDGLYFQARMDEEIILRQNFCRVRQKNGTKGGRPKNLQDNLQGNLRENENKNENKNISNTLYKEVSEVLSNTSNTTTTTTNCLFNTGEAHEMSVENYQQFKLDVENFFLKNHFISSPRAFIDYNESRGWLGSGGAPLWQEDRWKDYARLWEERRFDN